MTCGYVTACKLFSYFNSHPHEEDDVLENKFKNIKVISTHILTKRMTMERMNISFVSLISTHILTKRMTDGTEVYYPSQHISTHILTKRMTEEKQ